MSFESYYLDDWFVALFASTDGKVALAQNYATNEIHFWQSGAMDLFSSFTRERLGIEESAASPYLYLKSIGSVLDSENSGAEIIESSQADGSVLLQAHLQPIEIAMGTPHAAKIRPIHSVRLVDSRVTSADLSQDINDGQDMVIVSLTEASQFSSQYPKLPQQLTFTVFANRFPGDTAEAFRANATVASLEGVRAGFDFKDYLRDVTKEMNPIFPDSARFIMPPPLKERVSFLSSNLKFIVALLIGLSVTAGAYLFLREKRNG